MNPALHFSRLAIKLLTDLSTSEDNTTDEPLEMVQLSMVLKAFDDVSDIVEQQLRHDHKSEHSDSAPEDAGTIG